MGRQPQKGEEELRYRHRTEGGVKVQLLFLLIEKRRVSYQPLAINCSYSSGN